DLEPSTDAREPRKSPRDLFDRKPKSARERDRAQGVPQVVRSDERGSELPGVAPRLAEPETRPLRVRFDVRRGEIGVRLGQRHSNDAGAGGRQDTADLLVVYVG